MQRIVCNCLQLYNKFSDSFWAKRWDFGLRLNRYRFLKPSDYIIRDENNDEVNMNSGSLNGRILSRCCAFT